MITGFTCGSFDVLHAGHVHFLYQCSKMCDKLIVGLQVDPTINRPWKNKPVQSLYERFLMLRNCVSVNEIIPYETETDLINLLAMMPIHKRFLGSEYISTSMITGEDICNKRNIELIFVERLHNYSSSELRDRIVINADK